MMAKFKKMIQKSGVVHYFKGTKKVDEKDLPLPVKALLAGDETEVDFKTDEEKQAKAKRKAKASAKKNKNTPVKKEDNTRTVKKKTEPAGQVSYLSGEPATRRKYLNGELFWLTEEEYNTLNLGKLAQAVREKRETLEAKGK